MIFFHKEDGRVVIGVLALQGDFAKHIQALVRLNVEFLEVRYPVELDFCDGFIIPGGESTTMLREIDFIHLKNRIVDFSESKPVFGTCAGLILMAKEVTGPHQKSFGLIDVTVERNAFGRQIESFTSEVRFQQEGQKAKMLPGVFIRAPRIVRCGPDVKVLATFQDEPVLVRQGRIMGSTFHPELSEDLTIHRTFLDMIGNKK